MKYNIQHIDNIHQRNCTDRWITSQLILNDLIAIVASATSNSPSKFRNKLCWKPNTLKPCIPNTLNGTVSEVRLVKFR